MGSHGTRTLFVRPVNLVYVFFWVILRHLNFICSGYFRAKPSPLWIPQLFSNLVILHPPAYEEGTDRVFRNVGI
jgi:hypothetical protein